LKKWLPVTVKYINNKIHQMRISILLILIAFTQFGYAQRFDLGDAIIPSSREFELIGISSETGVKSYKYVGAITGYMFGRPIGDIIIGVKSGHVATTVYNMIPESSDIGVPTEIIDGIQESLPFPLAYRNGVYGVNIDNTSISISRTNNALTFNKDRIMYFSSVKRSLLLNK
jgi:hypothetical protein